MRAAWVIEQPATRGALSLAGIEAPMPPAMGGGGRDVESGSCRSQRHSRLERFHQRQPCRRSESSATVNLHPGPPCLGRQITKLLGGPGSPFRRSQGMWAGRLATGGDRPGTHPWDQIPYQTAQATVATTVEKNAARRFSRMMNTSAHKMAKKPMAATWYWAMCCQAWGSSRQAGRPQVPSSQVSLSARANNSCHAPKRVKPSARMKGNARPAALGRLRNNSAP